MVAATNSTPDLTSLQDDIAALKKDVGSLISHLSSDATGRVRSASDSVETGARQLCRGALTEGEALIKAVGRQVREQPTVALLIALGVGYIGGRFLTR